MTSPIFRHQLWWALTATFLIVVVQNVILTPAMGAPPGGPSCDQTQLTEEQRRILNEKKAECQANHGVVRIDAWCGVTCQTRDSTCHYRPTLPPRHEIHYSCDGRIAGMLVVISGSGTANFSHSLVAEFGKSLELLNNQTQLLRQRSSGKHCPACTQLLSESAALVRRAKAKLTANEAQLIKGSVDNLVGRIKQQILELHKAVPMSSQLPAASPPKPLPPGGPKPSPLPTPEPQPQPMPIPPGGPKPVPM